MKIKPRLFYRVVKILGRPRPLNKKAELAFTDLVERHKELSCFNSYQHITRASTHVIAATIVIKVLHVRNASVSGAYAALNKLK